MEFQQKLSKKGQPVIIDHIEDKTKSRYIFVFLSLLLYLHLTFRLILQGDENQTRLGSIKIQLKPPDSLFIGEYLNSSSPIIAKVLDLTQQPMEGVRLSIQAVRLEMTLPQEWDQTQSPMCGTFYRGRFNGSIEYIRLQEVCRQIYNGQDEVTDHFGTANFDGFRLENGPEAKYVFVIKAFYKQYQIISDEFSIYFRSNIVQMKVLTPAPKEIRIGKLDVQPRVQLLGLNGKPIKGQQVIIFSWPSPSFDFPRLPSFIYPNGRGLLHFNNSKSEPSDENGIAVFKNVHLLAYIENGAFIHFYKNGKTALWNDAYHNLLSDGFLPPQDETPPYLPDAIDSVNYTIKVIERGPQRVKSFDILTPAPKIRVVDKDGNGVAGLSCYASLVGWGTNIQPAGYYHQKFGDTSKYLRRPIPGIYKNNKIISTYLTDEKGELEFENMQFSKRGDYGNYSVIYGCGINRGEEPTIYYVDSYVDKVIMTTKFPSHVTVDTYQSGKGDFDVSMVFLGNGKGVEGQVVDSIEMVDNTTGQVIPAQIVSYKGILSSLRDGQLKIGVKILQMESPIMYANVTIYAVGQEIKSTKPLRLQLANEQQYNLVRFHLVTNAAYLKKEVNVNEKFNLEFVALDIKGNVVNLEKYQSDFEFKQNFYNAYQHVLPSNFIELNQDFTIVVRSGYVRINNISFKNGPSGDIPLILSFTTESLGKFQNIAYPSTITSQEIVVRLKLDAFVTRFACDTPISKHPLYPGDEIRGHAYLLDSQFKPVRNHYINSIFPRVTNIPAYTAWMYNENIDIIEFISVGQYTDYEGKVKLTYRFKPGVIGHFVWIVAVGYNYGHRIEVTVQNPIQSINIIQQPKFYQYSSLNIGFLNQKHQVPAQVRIEMKQDYLGRYDDFVITTFPISQGCNQTLSFFSTLSSKLEEGKENYPAFLDMMRNGQVALTNSHGLATFPDLTVIDMSNLTCQVQFKFIAGDNIRNDLFTVSNMTDTPLIYKYQTWIQTNWQVEVSKYITAQTRFPEPIQLSMKVNTQPRLIILLARLTQVFMNEVSDDDSVLLTHKYLRNSACMIYFSPNPVASGGCSITNLKSKIGNLPIVFDLKFDGLLWKQKSSQTDIRFNIGTQLQINKNVSINTRSIRVSAEATSLKFIQEPPFTIFVNDIFHFSVVLYSEGGTVLTDEKVHCNITSASIIDSFRLDRFQQLFTEAASKLFTIRKWAQMDAGFEIDRERSSSRTDDRGVARFNMKITRSPVPIKDMTVVCQHGSTISMKSEYFELKHNILEVSMVNNPIQYKVKMKFKKMRDEKDNVYQIGQAVLDQSAKLEVQVLSEDRIFIQPDEVGMFILNEHQIQTLNTFQVKAVEELKRLQVEKKEGIYILYDYLYKFARGVQDNVKINKFVNQQFVKKRKVEVVDNKRVAVKDIQIQVFEPGKYYLVFLVRGMMNKFNETNYQSHNQVFQFEVIDDTSFFTNVKVWLEVTVAVITFVFVLIFSSKYTRGIWLVFGMAAIGFYLYIILSSDSQFSTFFLVSATLISSATLILLLVVIVQDLVARCQGKPASTMYFYQKRKMQVEYTFQLLNGKPSNKWLADRGYIRKGKEEDSDNDSYDGQREENEEDPNPEEFVSVMAQTDSVSSRASSLLNTPKVLIEWEMSKPHCELSPWQRFKRVLTPFTLMYRQPSVPDCFMFPQHLLGSLMICILTLIFITFKSLQVFNDSLISIKSLQEKMKESVYVWINTGREIAVKFTIAEIKLDYIISIFDDILKIEYYTDQLYVRLIIGAYMGTFIACLLITLNLVWILYDYKAKSMQIRTGDYSGIEVGKLNIGRSEYLPAAIISNSIFNFLLILSLTSVIITLFTWPLFWEILWDYKWGILNLVSVLIVYKIIRIVVIRLSYSKHKVKRRSVIGVFEFIMFYIAILAGMFSSIWRMFKIGVFTLMCLIRIDVDSSSLGAGKITDFFYLAYIGSILSQHEHNNAILITFKELLYKVTTRVWSCQGMGEGEKEVRARVKVVRNRWRLWVFLSSNPKLVKYRKSMRAEEGEKAFENDEELKTSIN